MRRGGRKDLLHKLHLMCVRTLVPGVIVLILASTICLGAEIKARSPSVDVVEAKSHWGATGQQIGLFAMTCSSQRSQHHPARHYAVTVKQQQQNTAPASGLAESCLRQETAAGDIKGSN